MEPDSIPCASTSSSQNNGNCVDQFAISVRAFSSQYGADNSLSYTVNNILGEPKRFPEYGDFPESFSPRTYGMWWKKAPSALKRIRIQCYNHKSFESTDFIELGFESTIFLQSVSIYETYQPNSISAVWAYSIDGSWINLWKGKLEPGHTYATVFCPKLKNLFTPTSVIRLELDTTCHSAHPGIDAISIRGLPTFKKYKVQHSLNRSTEENVNPYNLEVNIKHDLLFLKKNFSGSEGNPELLGDFFVFPNETILKILNYLDLRTLNRCGQLSSYFYQIIMDSFLYIELNFKLYWAHVSSQVLTLYSYRCKYLQKLDLSWATNHVDQNEFIRFIEKCGGNLTHLRLDSAQFVGDLSLKHISRLENLIELSIANCQKITDRGFQYLRKLKHLEILNLYHTKIPWFEVIELAKANGKYLQHLQLGGNFFEMHLDEIAAALHNYSPNLESLDLWKSGQISPNGIKELAGCSHLRELDLGWCLGLTMPEDSFKILAMNCPLLEKLFLSALRGARDRDLEAIADYCQNLKQIDLMGAPGITSYLINRILTECSKLEFIDVSCCNQISNNLIEIWKMQFSNIKFQMVFQTE